MMTRTPNGDFVIKAATLKKWGMVAAGLFALGPSLGVGISLIAKDINRERDIAELKVKVAELPISIDQRFDKIDDQLTSINEYLRK